MKSTFDAEQVVLGSIIEGHLDADDVFTQVPAAEFSGPNMHIAETLHGLAIVGGRPDVFQLKRKLEHAGLLNRVGGAPYLHTLVSSARYSEDAKTHVEYLCDDRLRRSVRSLGQQLVQMADNPTIGPDEAVQRATDLLGRLDSTAPADETLGWPDAPPSEPTWVIPGLLASDDRLMLTGGEGLGKTMLTRQLAASVAVGLHPFSPTRFEPAPVLHVDLENTRWVTDKAWWHIRQGLGTAGIVVPRETLHRIEPRQFRISEAKDVAWLMRHIRSIEPRLVVVSPAYRMNTEDPNEERTAVKVQDILNQIRAVTHAALVLEGHASYAARGPDGDWRPRGSSAWLGWPEVGLGMKPLKDRGYRAAELVEWRGSRTNYDESWPSAVAAGRPFPWTEAPPV